MIKWLDEHLEEMFLVILLVIMTVLLGIQIVSRYVFNNSLSWSEELVRYLFVWSAFIGVPYCIKKGTSIKVDQFRNMMPVKFQKFLLYFDKIIMFALFLILTIFSYDVVRSTYLSGQTSAAMGIPMWIVQLSVLVGSILSLIRIVQNFYEVLSGHKKVEQKHGL
ncbi:TRAP-type C4-dicarboxylate transport system, small permease component [Anaerosphaera aminiphila DSM 21120]|uniref:TRAP-type C4-dicarboxylate transport system, small permease component n=1 Tax=Anaerosphaera aminiphila DSM 21120 TaxID=1120995 RepID=A0A1M5NQM2_9FIRM|nr:TRAP transporter small permease [Anaerosphaera aminiphila]SHG91810.1 TRAP-type C4-dicarboxylate transport system, small permease component [Anaerosphaera aminiphila DSM 21120]